MRGSQDAVLLLWLNWLAIPALDSVMTLVTGSYLVVIPVLILALSLAKGRKKYESRAFLYRALGSILATYLVTAMLKSVIAEPRPCAVLPVREIVGCDPSGSFPSLHAAIAFSVLPFFSGKGAILYFIYASLVATSRVYLGLHYPVDVVAGAVLGLVVGRLFAGKPAARAFPPARPLR